jgi:hypothetical protein
MHMTHAQRSALIVLLLNIAMSPSLLHAAPVTAVAESTIQEGDRPLQRVRLPDMIGWQADYNLNNDVWTLKNNEMKPRKGSYATATIYVQRLGSILPREPKALAAALTEVGALESGIRFTQVDKIEAVSNGFVIKGQEQSDFDPSAKPYPSFVMVRHLQGLNLICRQGSASDLEDAQGLVNVGMALCQKLTLY